MSEYSTKEQLNIIGEAMALMSEAQRKTFEITFDQALEIIKIQRLDMLVSDQPFKKSRFTNTTQLQKGQF